ncbi:hypothetical protein SAMN00768000_1241 [Sulfobacillus thermosulfidooxidans DSM 9293]|uniref:DUF5666 domain-containing protein n=2 Tax=Sulfobacillus thermosulfidooxidans TaxID=28034 RepID=A0A1W1WBS5_SULTA|nr:hypothetical protein [Sulfobacillus thermosulfidooxidans]SMC03727.1 hypothetical protein SAMN00768000_1241 [Sulfobacillus thermosulfidooxidans DSM 9293]
MKKSLGVMTAGAMVSVLALSGAAFAQKHHDQKDHPKHMETIHGVFESGSFTGSEITVKTSSGKLVTIDLTGSTRISLEAQGSVSAIMTALQKHQLRITAEVKPGTKAFMASKIEAHLNVEKDSHHQDHKDAAKKEAHHKDH